MPLYKTSKVVLRFLNNSAEFINGLTANDVRRPQNAFVSIHGKIIAACDQIAVDEEEHWIILEPGFVDALLAHLERYVKLGGVKVERPAKNIYFDLDGSAAPKAGEHAVAQKAGQLIVTDAVYPADVTEEEFALFRVRNNIPLQGADYHNDFLLNVSVTDLVSFTKGCYLGQEPVSKVYNRSRPTWKLVVRAEDECSPEEKEKMTSRVTDPADGRVKGFVFVSNK